MKILALDNVYCEENFYELQYNELKKEFWRHDLNDLYTLIDALQGHRENLDNTDNRYKENNKRVLQEGTGKYITVHKILGIEVYMVTELLDNRELITKILLHYN